MAAALKISNVDDAAIRQGDFPVVRKAIPVRIRQRTGKCQPLRLEIAREVNVEGPEVESIPVRASKPEVHDYITAAQAVAPIEPEYVRAGAAVQRVSPLAAEEPVVPIGASDGVCAIRAD